MAPPRVRSQRIGPPTGTNRPGFRTPKTFTPVNVDRIMNQPMSPGMSVAMAGNTGLAGLSENQANQIKQAQQAINQFQDQFTGNTSEPVSFKSIGQRFGEFGSEYRRPADKFRYADRMRMINEGLAGGGKFFVGDDGIARFSFMGMENKPTDSSGRSFLSILLPEMTATPPTFSQMLGDASRAFTGFDSLKYPSQDFQGPFPAGQSANMAFMQRTPGMFDNFKPLPLRLLEGISDVANRGIGLFQDMREKDKSFNEKLMRLSTSQRRIYDQEILKPGATREQAYNKAIGMAMGGIATLQ